jgi:serine/threonine-protein kinase
MLLEAGYLDRGMPRMQEAIAISPSRRGIGWEIARAWALEQRWDDHDRLIEELRASGIDRAFVRARHAAWRRENGLMDTYAKDMAATSRGAFVPGLLGTLVAVYTDQPWPPLREKLLELAFQDTPNHRRRTFVAQLAAEGAGWAGDVATCVRLVAYAVDHGLFDLHWLERCSLLTGLRASADYARLRDPIRERAEAILDALYGDHDLGTSATAIAVGLP